MLPERIVRVILLLGMWSVIVWGGWALWQEAKAVWHDLKAGKLDLPEGEL